MRIRASRGVSTAVMALLWVAAPQAVFGWTFLGVEDQEIALPTEVYIDWDSRQKIESGIVIVDTLHVLSMMQHGIDVFYPDGIHAYDLRYVHRSYLKTAAYDCAEREWAEIKVTYYPGKKPEEGSQVFQRIEDLPVFNGPVLGLPSKTLVLDAVCEQRDPAQLKNNIINLQGSARQPTHLPLRIGIMLSRPKTTILSRRKQPE